MRRHRGEIPRCLTGVARRPSYGRPICSRAALAACRHSVRAISRQRLTDLRTATVPSRLIHRPTAGVARFDVALPTASMSTLNGLETRGRSPVEACPRVEASSWTAPHVRPRRVACPSVRRVNGGRGSNPVRRAKGGVGNCTRRPTAIRNQAARPSVVIDALGLKSVGRLKLTPVTAGRAPR